MDLARLRTFQTVVDKRSFSRAAAALGCTQSTVSFHIRLATLAAEAQARLRQEESGEVGRVRVAASTVPGRPCPACRGLVGWPSCCAASRCPSQPRSSC